MYITDTQELIKITVPIILLIAGIIIGVVAELIMLNFRKKAHDHHWDIIVIVLNSQKGLTKLWGLLLGGYGAILYLPLIEKTELRLSKSLMVIFMFTLILVTARITEALLNLYTTKVKGVFPSISLFTNIIKMIIFILGFLVILQFLGLSITPILTALGVGGLAVALALQDTLSNLFAGIQTIVSRQVKPGDYIKLSATEEGYVEDITWRNTTIRSLAGNMIIAPNNKISTAIITNYYQPTKNMTLLLDIGIRKESDIHKAEKILLELAAEVMKEKCPDIVDYTPTVRYHSVTDNGVNLRVHLLVDEFKTQFTLRHEFIKRLYISFEENHIDQPFQVKMVG